MAVGLSRPPTVSRPPSVTQPSSLCGPRWVRPSSNSLRSPAEELTTLPPPTPSPSLRRRELSLCVPRVELRLYRRTHTSSDLIPRPPHFIYLLRCDWTGEQLPRDAQSSMGRGSPRPASPRPLPSPRMHYGSEGSLPSPRGQQGPPSSEFAAPWPWWDPLPGTYVVRRRWHEIVRFHEALTTELAFDSKLGCRRVKARVPSLPERVDVNAWLHGYAATGDACCLGRTLSSECWTEERERSLEELKDLHWLYVRNRLMPYFAEVNAVLRELPTGVLAASTSLRRLVTGGVSGRRQPSPMPVPPRFLGPTSLQPSREDIAAALQLMKRSGSAPNLLGGKGAGGQRPGARKSLDDDDAPSGSKPPGSPSAAAAQLVLAKSTRR
mmetsp:Transcript_7371/g.23229  ORF Transcript_7371/g.23229 Transcript_7371/m.23229 type:complete len:380 (+) Transcript_7371:85-1224(+)